MENKLRVMNTSNTDTLRFQSVLHTYFRLPEGLSPSDTQVTGLQGQSYLDKMDGEKIKSQEAEMARFDEPFARVYHDGPDAVSLVRVSDGARIFDVQQTNWKTWTVFNPAQVKGDGMSLNNMKTPYSLSF